MRPSGLVLALLLVWPLRAPGQTGPVPADDATFRPTVIVRHDAGQGSGTVVASVPGEALVLTAAHVVGESTPRGLVVEFHRYNLGMERRSGEGWPVAVPAELVAADAAGDVAVLRLRGRRVLPYVARLAPVGTEPRPESVVTSFGIDGRDHLSSWQTRVVDVAWMSMSTSKSSRGPESEARVTSQERRGRYRTGDRPRSSPNAATPERLWGHRDPGNDTRPFFLTEHPPRPGRSGGGLFDGRGRVVGVCVGRVEAGSDEGRGLFATSDTVRQLLREHGLDVVVERSEQLHAERVP